MPLSAGTRLGSYEILSALGAGGMGEVYRARDTKLNREVAIKVLLPAVANDPERLARFSREAQVLASLNHPNIAAIYGLEEIAPSTASTLRDPQGHPELGRGTTGSGQAGSGPATLRALVMELVEGPTLADRIAQGPLPLAEALPIAKQIVDALEAAHDKGIVHRDLKPANIKVRDDGTVKVLDFGLAKALDPVATASASVTMSPTLSTPAMTHAGIILGTAAYMSPEQARGRTVDKRADIWAFGVVLHEMLTGRRLFQGEDMTETLAAVVMKEPDLSDAPERVRRVLRRCLEKDPKKRLRDISGVELLLEEAAVSVAGAATRPPASPWPWVPWALSAVAGIAAVALAVLYVRQPEVATLETSRLEVSVPDDVTLTDSMIRLSPDGRMIAFSARGGGDNRTRLWVRRLDALEARPLAGTEGTPGGMFWSPDGRFLIFGSGGKLRKVAIDGGPAQSICDFSADVGGGFFTPDNTFIVFGTPATGGVQRCPAGGGAATSITTFKPGGQEVYHAFPVLLPDGKHFLFRRDAGPESGIYAGSLDGRPEEQTGTRVLADPSAPVYVPAANGGPGLLLFVREGTLMAQAFDAEKLAVTGEAFVVGENVRSSYSVSASADGTLAYLTRATENVQHTWYDRQGKPGATLGAPMRPFSNLRFSPDGKRLAADRSEPGAHSDIWVMDVTQGSETRLTTDPNIDSVPVWSPDGTRVTFTSEREGTQNLYLRSADGAGRDELLLKTGERKTADDWSRNGFLLFRNVTSKGNDLWVLPMEASATGERKPVPYLNTEFDEGSARFSPDGKFVAYQSNSSGAFEIYVRPFDASAPDASNAAPVKVSQGGGTGPRWRADGKELRFSSPDRKMMVVDVTLAPQFKAGAPRVMFSVPQNVASTLGTPDMQQFLWTVPVGGGKEGIEVVLNWQGLRR